MLELWQSACAGVLIQLYEIIHKHQHQMEGAGFSLITCIIHKKQHFVEEYGGVAQFMRSGGAMCYGSQVTRWSMMLESEIEVHNHV